MPARVHFCEAAIVRETPLKVAAVVTQQRARRHGKLE
jgi:hypothetical protein